MIYKIILLFEYIYMEDLPYLYLEEEDEDETGVFREHHNPIAKFNKDCCKSIYEWFANSSIDKNVKVVFLF